MRTFLLLIALWITTTTLTFANPIDSSKVASRVAEYVKAKGFSGTILVAHQGKPIYHQSLGLAYRSTPDTIRNDYHYSVASVTKLFTALRILQLAEKDFLDLTDPVIQYLPAFQADISKAVTVHHLLLHISGLPNEKTKTYRAPLDPTQIVAHSLQNKKNGQLEQFNYNNLDYVLLGLIIEAITGNDWDKEIQTYILDPLQMEETGFLAYGYYPKNFAYTYSQSGKKLKQDPFFYIENFYAAGNMYSTTTDLLKLDQALYSNQLLSEESKQTLAKSYPEYNYVGYSVWNYKYPFVERKPTIMERRGGILGANVVLVRLTEENYTIILLSNDDRFNPDSFGDENNLREILIRTVAQ